jgi:hypothetical protein
MFIFQRPLCAVIVALAVLGLFVFVADMSEAAEPGLSAPLVAATPAATCAAAPPCGMVPAGS